MREKNIWIEINILFVPEQNGSKQKLDDIAKFIAEVDKNITWHISCFHPDYQFIDSETTPIETLQMAKEIGEKHGLKHIYLGKVLL